MPIYEYQGKQYDVATDDPSAAKAKILSYLGTQEAPKPAPVAQKPTPSALSSEFNVGLRLVQPLAPAIRSDVNTGCAQLPASIDLV